MALRLTQGQKLLIRACHRDASETAEPLKRAFNALYFMAEESELRIRS